MDEQGFRENGRGGRGQDGWAEGDHMSTQQMS